MGLARRAAADASVTFLWAFSIALLPAMGKLLALSLHVHMLFIMVTLVTLHIISFGILGDLVGGASFNPTASLAAVLTTSDESFSSLAVTVPAQMAGAVGGVRAIRAIRAVMPPQLQNMVQGPALQVPLLAGTVAEGMLTFAITLVVLWALRRISVPRMGVLVVTSMALVAAGASVTGPAMNPANAFAWAYMEGWHATWEHFVVYWVGPTVGTVVAARVFNWLFRAPKEKVKAL